MAHTWHDLRPGRASATWLALATWASLAACAALGCGSSTGVGSDAAVDSGRTDAGEDAAADSGGTDAGPASDAGPEPDAGPTADAGSDAGAACTEYDISRLCVRGTPTDEGEEIAAGSPVQIQIYPEGCHSSACTVVDEASCTASVDGTSIRVDGGFCLHTEGACTLPDCGGGGTAECETAEALEAGEHTASLDGLSVIFSVPGTVPFGGECDAR